MKDYKLDELMILRDELMKSLTPEQQVLMETLMDAVVKNVEEIKDLANNQMLDSKRIIDGLNGDLNKLQGAFDLMVEQLRSLGIKIVD